MLYREIIAVCSQIHTKHINTLCGLNGELYIKIQSVPHSKHSVSVIKTSQLMLYREIIAVCSQIHTKHINTLCGQNVELLNVKLAVYRVSQEEYPRLREDVPYVKVYRYNPKHLCPKLNGYGDNGQRKVWFLAGPSTVPVS